MTPVIWKFTLRPWSIFVDLPKGAEVLSVGAQGPDVVVWAMINPDALRVKRKLAALPTGQPVPPALRETRFVGTAQMDDGLVFHVFDGGEIA